MLRIGIDTGGTFTDIVLFDELKGTLERRKKLSSPRDPASPIVSELETIQTEIRDIVVGSTIATNTLLERSGARVAFVTTKGFKDLLEIGRQERAEIFGFGEPRPRGLVAPVNCFEVEERVSAQGEILVPLKSSAIDLLIERLAEDQFTDAAVCLLFSYLHPEHERKLGRSLREAGFNVSLSSDILPQFREFERASTTVINAYVAGNVNLYLSQLEISGPSNIRILQSNGGSFEIADAREQPVRSILSGPAAGVVGALQVARAAGFENIITMDMGGTSTDVSICRGQPTYSIETVIDGLPISIPMIDIHTIGAGGGSIARIDHGDALQVGPESAGSEPGPICYARGGTRPTVTDANLVLNRLRAEDFSSGELQLNINPAIEGFRILSQEGEFANSGKNDDAQTAALGVVEVVNQQMVSALRKITLARGHNPENFLLVCFGGAGGLHAAAVSRTLGCRKALIPRGASTLSAFGALTTDLVRDFVRSIPPQTTDGIQRFDSIFMELESMGRTNLAASVVDKRGQLIMERYLDLRYQGQSFEITVPLNDEYEEAFHHNHARLHGFEARDRSIECVNVRLRASVMLAHPELEVKPESQSRHTQSSYEEIGVVFRSGIHKSRLHDGTKMDPGDQAKGPAVIVLPDTSILLEPGDRLQVDPQGNFLLELEVI